MTSVETLDQKIREAANNVAHQEHPAKDRPVLNELVAKYFAEGARYGVNLASGHLQRAFIEVSSLDFGRNYR